MSFTRLLRSGGAISEVPAAALVSPLVARHAGFFSSGTNDLIQYTRAIDRGDDEVNYLYDPLHPAVLQLISHTINAGVGAHIPVTMCGEMRSEERRVGKECVSTCRSRWSPCH